MIDRKKFLRHVAALMAAGGCALGAAGAAAQEAFPSRPVKLIVPVAAGGGIDTAFRAIAPAWSEELGQQVVIDNRPGGGQVLGTNAVAKSRADGYTLLAAGAPIAFNTALGRKLPYDVSSDLIPVSEVVKQSLLIAVHPDLPVKSVRELVQYVKDAAAPLQYTTGGIGSYPHLWWEMFRGEQRLAGQHVPYNGIAPAMQDVMAGRVPLLIDAIVPSGVQAKAGTLRAIALVGKDRSRLLPDVPTLTEQGFSGFDAGPFYGILAPAGTSATVIAKLHSTLTAALARPAVRTQLEGQGFIVVGGSPAEYSKLIHDETARWSDVVRRAGIKVE